MARKDIDVEALNCLVPELPENFERWAKYNLPNIPIYYRREKKGAECTCGKCAETYRVNETPIRYKAGKCAMCGHVGRYEWKKVTHGDYYCENIYLLQRTKDNNLIYRVFNVNQYYQQWRKAVINITECSRHFLTMGDTARLNNVNHYNLRTGKWERQWGTGQVDQQSGGRIYPGYKTVIKNSNLKYCDVDKLIECMESSHFDSEDGKDVKMILIAYANNPAIEMYAKAGMNKLVRDLIYNSGKRKYLNRRGKSLSAQIRIKDKSLIKKLVEQQGDPRILKSMQYEEKNNVRYTDEQRKWLVNLIEMYNGQKYLNKFLQYMTLQQAMNRIAKYEQEDEGFRYIGKIEARYYDYLVMREELGYDMTNEVFIYPKNLIEKHNEMVKEKNAKADEVYIQKKMEEYTEIAKQFKKWDKKYHYEEDGWIIRPARDAAEIVMEGRILHHCVGRDTYLSRHNKGESIILFLREGSKADEPYCTIEIKDKTIVQWYEANDKKPHKDIIDPLLERFVEQIGKKKNKSVTEQLCAAV